MLVITNSWWQRERERKSILPHINIRNFKSNVQQAQSQNNVNLSDIIRKTVEVK